MRAMMFIIIPACLLSLAASSEPLQPRSLQHIGAFRLPEDPGWEYSGYGMTFLPDGDPSGGHDGFPGSLLMIGHDHGQLAGELSIPAPAPLADGVDHLPRALQLRGFVDLTGGMFGELEIPRGDIEYLPGSGTIWFCRGQHMEFELRPCLGMCRSDLADPVPMGPWFAGGLGPYVTNDYLFDMPSEWSEDNLPGALLVCGRFRDGTWGGMGPAMVALVPEGCDPPPPGGSIGAVPLLMYGTQAEESTELRTDPAMAMDGFGEADEWSGGAWITSASGSAVILAGTRAIGRCWYGYPNGVEYPTSGDPSDPIPEMPPWPWNDRGWWSADISAGLLFFDPDDLAEVASGTMDPWEPQPYAFLGIDSLLADPGYDLEREKRYSLGACAFDRDHGILYVVERRADGDASIIHVFRVR